MPKCPGGAQRAPLPPDLARRPRGAAPDLRRPGRGRTVCGAATAGGADLGISRGVLPGGGAIWHGNLAWENLGKPWEKHGKTQLTHIKTLLKHHKSDLKMVISD